MGERHCHAGCDPHSGTGILFGVSTDELFDYNRLEAEKKWKKSVWEASKFRKTDPHRSEAMLREGLKQFPGNEIILNNLLYTMSAPERARK